MSLVTGTAVTFPLKYLPPSLIWKPLVSFRLKFQVKCRQPVLPDGALADEGAGEKLPEAFMVCDKRGDCGEGKNI